MTNISRQTGVGGILTLVIGCIITLFALIFLIGGAYLASLGGSLYYLVCGLVLAASGILMIMGRLLGAWLYLLAWAGTLVWTIYEVGFEWWGWLPRLFGPTILAIIVVFCVPALRRRDAARAVVEGAA